MKNILIALDYHPSAQKIAEEGMALVKAFNAKVLLTHIISNDTFYGMSGYDPIMGFNGYVNIDVYESEKERIAILEKSSYEFLFNVKQHLGDITMEAIVKEGNVSESIIEITEDRNVDIIVIGTHSQSWISNLLIGSTAQKLIHKANKLLYIVPSSNNT